MEVLCELEKFLLNEVIVDSELDKHAINPEKDLISSGIIDSMGILKLVAFIEKTFAIRVNNEDIVPENFQTLRDLTEFVHKKIA